MIDSLVFMSGVTGGIIGGTIVAFAYTCSEYYRFLKFLKDRQK